MKRFIYICADPGVPVPGTKGSSIHVECVCRAFAAAGLAGVVYAASPTDERVAGLPLGNLGIPPAPRGESPQQAEARLFLADTAAVLADSTPADFVYERYSLWHTAGLARARELDVPFILEVNSPLPEEARRYRTLEHEARADGVAELLCEEADGIVCVSAEVAAWVSKLRGGSENVWIIPNGVDAERFAPRRGSRPAALPARNVPLIAFAGSFRPWHGLDDHVEAFAQLPAASHYGPHLVCVGDGPEREALKRKFAMLGVASRVHLPGRVPHADVPVWIGGADAAVAPYPAVEGFYFSPLKIYEFMALGLPIVASAIGQVRDIVPDGERGFLYPPGNAAALAATISRVITDHAEAERRAENARAWVLEHATWNVRVREILERIAALS